MRVLGGSKLFAVTLAVGLIAAPDGVLAQDEDLAPTSEPVVIEIFGESASTEPDTTAEPASGPPAKTAEDPAAADLSPAGEIPLAATASAGGSGNGQSAAGRADPQEEVDPFVGSFSTAAPIQVPAFHGIEPNLALTYNSSRGNGFVGVGWELAGLSVIERASPGKGTPNYDSNDIFLLDGQELIACVAGTVSPSCATGGSHATKVESYLRIKQDTIANTWEVTGRDGAVTTYSAVMGPNTSVEPDTYRWAMSSVVDTHGNTVTYNWWCDGTPAVECYPDTITYNGNTVTIYREARTDPVKYAIGSALADSDYRLKTIDVSVAGGRSRAYELVYAASTSTSRSLLASVRQFGRDAILDAGTGSITSGTSLPASQFGWPAEAVPTGTAGPYDEPMMSGDYGASGFERSVGDINGDGKTDLIFHRATASGEEGIRIRAVLSNGDGTFTAGPYDEPMMSGDYGASGFERSVGDINGDGKTDLIFHRATASGEEGIRIRAVLSNGDGTFTAGPYDEPMMSGDYGASGFERSVGDINGDGKTDLIFHRATASGEEGIRIRAVLSNGDGTFTAGPYDEPMMSGDYGASGFERSVGDINGDGKTDLIFHRATASGEEGIRIRAVLSNGDGTFTAGPYDEPMMSGDYGASGFERSVGDINGDGKTDLIFHRATASGEEGIRIRAVLSNGEGTFTAGPYDEPMMSGDYGASGFERSVGDINGDGKTDLIFHRATASGEEGIRIRAVLSNGDGTFTAGPYDEPMMSGDYGASGFERSVGDINGDGKTDLIFHRATASGEEGIRIRAVLTDGQTGLRLTSITNPLGGTTTVDYTPSSAWANQNLPMVLQTVSSITTDDGRGTPTSSSTTTYAYEGGLWHSAERRFLGFRKATTTLPCIAGEAQCPYSETTFRQDLASAGRVEQVDRFDGAGTLLTRALQEYVVNDTTAPYTALNNASESQIIVGAVTRRTRVTRDFDAYANVILETVHGDADVTGDEITAATDYVPNTADYIVSLPARLRSFDGIGTAGTLLTESRIIYDMYDPAVPFPPPAPTGNTSWNQPPTRGDANETQDWLDTESRFISAQAGYDTYGNVTVTIDPLGRRSEIDYDTTYNLYPIAARNPLYFAPTNDNRHQTSTSWDFVCGVPEVVTDLNGNTTTTQYDALCRPIRTDLPDGGFTITDYVSIGTPTAQYIQTETPPAGGTGNVWSRTYMDGFGRPYRSTARGPAAGQDITADTAYDARGNVASQTAPYYTGDPVYTTSFDYDALDRPTRTTHADANWVETAYGVAGVFLSTTSHDELGHPVTIHLDAFGRSVRREEPLATPGGTVTVKTDYGYDDLGRLNAITDDVGNAWAYTHDSLGRTLTVDDPDLGLWTKTYDDAGQLETQTDALVRSGETTGQVTRFTYDALGRMLTKTARYGALDAEQTTYTYDEAVAGFHNVGLLTRAENPTGTLNYRYDAMGREAQRIYTIDGTARTLASGFDIAGRLIWQDYPDGDAVGSVLDPITYDEAGRLYAIPGLVTHSAYDASGNAEAMAFGNGVVTGYGFSDQRGWLDSLVTTSGATTIQNMTYGRDAAGQIKSVASPFTDESWTYAYDALRRLLSATNLNTAAYDRTYTYDTIGNMLSNSGVSGAYSYPAAGADRPHAVTSVGSWSYTYDANGNMETGAGRSYTYNGDNRPTQIDTQTYSYGPDGERWKTVDSAPGGGTTLYLGGSIEIAAGVMTKYLPGNAKRVGSPGDPLVETFWLHHDHQGSIQAITDAAGTQVQRFTYYPYGDRIATASAHEESKGWIGERQDATGLFYLHARYYDPVIGRFNSADPSDPMAPGVGLNRYAYAFNTPIMRVDPWGLWADDDYTANREFDSGADGRYGSSYGYSGNEHDARDRIIERQSQGIMQMYPPAPPLASAQYRLDLICVGACRSGELTPDYRARAQAIDRLFLGTIGGFVPGSGFYDAYGNYNAGNYWAGTFDAVTELPGLKQADGVLDAISGFASFRRSLPCNSFAEGTLVVTPDGELSIETLLVGDLVLARSEATGEEDWQEVTATFAEHHDSVLVLTTKGQDGEQHEIVTTSNHPFHVLGRGWVHADALVAGNVVSAADGQIMMVVAANVTAEPQIAYNLEVAEYHTYFVGESRVWVHNGTPCGGNNLPTPARNLPFDDPEILTEVNKTLDRIEAGGPFPYPRNDGVRFGNREQLLPTSGNYLEYTVDTPGLTHRGQRRIVVDQNTGTTYYTDDHYKHFVVIDPTSR